ncbi:EXORDIUM like 5 [Actinidia rufa]|uniref:EXORDIUM like 5 n=1 Tax=Actinidia rufa TaxID=165716 RepID=A0A7J0F8H8_9ERIC|nr:EXORDIUM like 5 [Actinidia rufa]
MGIIGQGVADHGGEGEVVEAANGAAEILYGDVLGGKDEVDPVPVVDGEGFGLDGGGDNLLDGKAGEVGAVGVTAVAVLTGDENGSGDVGAGLVGVEGDRAPPVGDRRGGGGAVVVGGDGEEEVLDEELLGGGPLAVPDEVNVDGGGEHGSHVVTEVDEVRRSLEFLGGREGSGWELWVVDLGLHVEGFKCWGSKCRWRNDEEERENERQEKACRSHICLNLLGVGETVCLELARRGSRGGNRERYKEEVECLGLGLGLGLGFGREMGWRQLPFVRGLSFLHRLSPLRCFSLENCESHLVLF